MRSMATPNATAPSAYEPLSPSILSRHNFLLQSFFTVLVVCVGTRILSEYRFRTIRHAKYTCQPPTVPYWIPFLRHAFSMAWDSQRFAAKCLYVPTSLCADVLRLTEPFAAGNMGTEHPSTLTRRAARYSSSLIPNTSIES